MESLRLLPTQLQQMTLSVGSGQLDLGHLVCLHELILWTRGQLTAAAAGCASCLTKSCIDAIDVHYKAKTAVQ